MPSSPDTLLRRIRSAKLPENPEPSVIGVDDWSYRHGVKFGTIICNLNNHTTLDLLPDRNSETLSCWLEAHKHLAIISRDRAGEYSKAAQEGAPQAIQVADRWHLLKNIVLQLRFTASTVFRTVSAMDTQGAAHGRDRRNFWLEPSI